MPTGVYPRKPAIDRFIEKTSKSANDDGCWTWIASQDGHGYGKFYAYGKCIKAYKFAYEHYIGPVPEGKHLDHLCRNRICVNPYHLEPVSQRENTLRGEGLAARVVRSNRCNRGHELTEENVYRHGNARYCKTCKRARGRKPCRRCGSPKSEGQYRHLCDQCESETGVTRWPSCGGKNSE